MALGDVIARGIQGSKDRALERKYQQQFLADQKAGERANALWTSQWEPQWEKYGAQMQGELNKAFDRSYAEAQGKLGYGLSMSGSGEGGLAEASRLALTTEAQNKRMDIASQRDIALQQAYMQFMTTKDQQAFEMAKMGAAYQYNKQLAEMNEPSWWESLGGIVGMGAAMFGIPSFGGGTNVSGGTALRQGEYMWGATGGIL